MKFVHTADTHLGFDFVKAPSPDEKGRRRRAEWIYRNFLAVVEHALSIQADLFIHSGDLFNKFYIPRDQLNPLVTHQAFDGAIVGPADFTFKTGRSDTVSREKLPLDFEYVAAGHIHRHQALPHPMKPRLSIVYPGSIQRMSFAEIHEEKGFVVGETIEDRIESRFMPLSAWDMEVVEISGAGKTAEAVRSEIIDQSWRFREDLVIRFSLTGGVRKGDYPEIDFYRLRMELPTALECLFAVKTEKRWIIR
ncbi:MAG: metallophosphoesterase [Thermodesulfobacteriota bacterium]